MNDAPILLVAGNALAHLTRLLSLAPLLREQGHDVIVAAEGARWLGLVRDEGYPVIELPLNIDSTALTRGSLALPKAVVRRAVDHDRALLRQLKPRFVLLDWRHTMRLAAALEGIPVIAIAHAQVICSQPGNNGAGSVA